MLDVTMVELREANLMGIRVFNVLMRGGYRTLQDIENLTYEQALLIRNSGVRTSQDIMDLIQSLEKTSKREELIRIGQIRNLKIQMNTLLNINKNVNSRKATLLLNLAQDKACSFGELRNAIHMCSKILM
ncbi:hypothetical protein [Clostridium tagluense]|uniref:RNA polymerase alpha subunit C-terminal domain-containing protein n=1 Tax=Clostridium tagluense TaxID=360422 RepID=A0A401USS6_9CLOT|nr:hypothetical protein [Clostridium tagluense]GCD12612.1 hypothetical protein Ctaglu_42350 [Clostridium tagluense]